MADRGLTIERMVRLAQVSRASYYRFEESARSGSEPDMELREPFSESRWNGPATGGAGSRRNYAAAVGG
jgi:hypothetical protein